MECKRDKWGLQRGRSWWRFFRKGKFEFLALTETKLKGNKEVPWCGVNGITADVQEIERAREGVAVLLNNMWHSAEIDFGCVTIRIL